MNSTIKMQYQINCLQEQMKEVEVYAEKAVKICLDLSKRIDKLEETNKVIRMH